MKARSMIRLCGWLLLAAAVLARSQTTPVTGKPTESVHRKGPDGLEGWTLGYAVPGLTGTYSEALVIARNGHILRKIDGHPFIWRWTFIDGARIAYETGPLHFSDECFLIDLTTGKSIANYDCYHWQPSKPPSWVN